MEDKTESTATKKPIRRVRMTQEMFDKGVQLLKGRKKRSNAWLASKLKISPQSATRWRPSMEAELAKQVGADKVVKAKAPREIKAKSSDEARFIDGMIEKLEAKIKVLKELKAQL